MILYWHELNKTAKEVINKCKENSTYEKNGLMVEKENGNIWIAAKPKEGRADSWIQIIKKTVGRHGYGYPKIKSTDSAMDY